MLILTLLRLRLWGWRGLLGFWTVMPASGSSILTDEYLVDNWTVDHGLPQNSITSIAQTSDGYLWLATFGGLVRFDGVRFTVFDSANTPELKSSRVVHLCLDRHQALWIVSEFGDLARLAEGKFAAFTAADGLPPNGAGILGEDAPGNLWMAGRRNEGCFRLEDGKFIRRIEPSPGTDNSIFALVSDSEGTLWAAQTGELLKLESAALRRFPPRRGGWQDQGVQRLARSQDGGIWAMSAKGLSKLRQSEWSQPLNVPVEIHGTASVHEDRNGGVWVGTWSQGLLWQRAGESFQSVKLTPSPSPEAMRAIFEDREGNLWIGTDGTGLFRLKRRLFKTYGVSDGLVGRMVKSITEDHDGKIWALNHSQVTWFPHGQPPGLNPTNLAIPAAWCALADRQGSLWIGSYGTGLYRYDQAGLFQFPKPEGKRSWIVSTLMQDRAGAIWAGGEEGLWRVEGQTIQSLARPDSLAQWDVRAMAEDGFGNLYVGLNGGGLLRYQSGIWTRWTKRDGLADDRVWSLYVDVENTVWIGTFGNGLNRLKDGKFFSFSAPQLRLPGIVASILEDAEANLWMGSNRGVFRVSRRELNEAADGRRGALTLVNYSQADGLGTIECTGGLQPAACRGADGRLWFATVNGLSVVDPARLTHNPHPPPVVIEEVLINGQVAERPHANQESPSENTLAVPQGSRRLEIHFTGLSFTASEKVRFKYRLDDFDDEWINAGTRRSVEYQGLAPGDYRFRVTACNNDGVWNETGAVLALTVLPYFWQTAWFRISAAGVLLATGAGVARFVSVRRWRRKLERLEHLHALERERARIAQDIHDDFGARLTQVSLLSELARRKADQPEEMIRHVEKIGDQARTMAQVMDEIVWAVDPTKDTLDNLANYLALFVEEFLQGSSVRGRLDVPPELPAIPLSAEIRHGLFLAVKEALNNIVKHARASEVWLRLRAGSSRLQLTVEDNGCGFEIALIDAKGGNGLGNMARRLRELGGEFEMTSEVGRGTAVKLTVPLGAAKRR